MSLPRSCSLSLLVVPAGSVDAAGFHGTVPPDDVRHGLRVGDDRTWTFLSHSHVS